MNLSHARLLRLISVFKFLKAALLIAAGIGILKLVHADVVAQAIHWTRRFGLDPGSRIVNYVIERLTSTPPRRIRELGIGTFLYAGLFLTEGIGLWLLKRWGEWFTVIATGSLIPIEVYELVRRPNLIKTGVLMINIAVVVYLIVQIKRERHQDVPDKTTSRAT